jgi:hypothetical protein
MTKLETARIVAQDALRVYQRARTASRNALAHERDSYAKARKAHEAYVLQMELTDSKPQVEQ